MTSSDYSIRIHPIPIRGILDIGFCWVCGQTGGTHLHHVVPQAYGGRDGPQVSICGKCHTQVHSDGLKDEPLDYSHTPQPYQMRMEYLVDVIKRARITHKHLITIGKVKKEIKITVELNEKQIMMLETIKRITQAKSNKEALQNALSLAYARIMNR